MSESAVNLLSLSLPIQVCLYTYKKHIYLLIYIYIYVYICIYILSYIYNKRELNISHRLLLELSLDSLDTIKVTYSLRYFNLEYIYIDKYIYICIYIYTCVYWFIDPFTTTRGNKSYILYIYMYISIYKFRHIYIYIYTHIYTYMYTHTHTHIYIYIYIYIMTVQPES